MFSVYPLTRTCLPPVLVKVEETFEHEMADMVREQKDKMKRAEGEEPTEPSPLQVSASIG